MLKARWHCLTWGRDIDGNVNDFMNCPTVFNSTINSTSTKRGECVSELSSNGAFVLHANNNSTSTEKGECVSVKRRLPSPYQQQFYEYGKGLSVGALVKRCLPSIPTATSCVESREARIPF
jgi:hypothetical protein